MKMRGYINISVNEAQEQEINKVRLEYARLGYKVLNNREVFMLGIEKMRELTHKQLTPEE